MAVFRLPDVLKLKYYVYAIMCQDRKGDPLYVKIGRTSDITERLHSLRTGCPIPFRIYAFLDIGHRREKALDVELALHREFAGRKTAGEWFRFDSKSPEDKRAFNDRSKRVLERLLGSRHPWWQKFSASAFDEYLKSKAASVDAEPYKQTINYDRRRRRRQQAWKELDAYRTSIHA